MTNEEKQLLLTDLCARLPYGVIVHHDDYWDKDYPRPNEILTTYNLSQYEKDLERWNIKPYLRPMSSMTEEEKKEFSAFGFEVIDHINANREECPKYQVIEVSNFSGITKITYWLNAHHFDYHGLIPMGLALEAPEGMYKNN